MPLYKNIPVSPDVYETVTNVARANHRTLGGQVALWAEAEVRCDHPQGYQTLLGETEVFYPDTRVTVPVRLYHCRECGTIVALPAYTLEGDTQGAGSTEAGQPLQSTTPIRE